jgi:hypothetical protein
VVWNCRLVSSRSAPFPFADLVGDGLAGVPQVAQHLGLGEVRGLKAVADQQPDRDLGRDDLAGGGIVQAGWDPQAEMETGVDHDPDGAPGLRHQEAQPGGGAVEGAQLVHEPLGVQAPPFAVARDLAQRGLEAREGCRQEADSTQLQVVSGDALVVEKVCHRQSGTRPAGTVQTTTPGRAPSSVGGR